MNKILLAFAAMVGVVVMLIFFYRWDSGKNRGNTWGYYGEFNTVSNSLAKIRGVTIRSSWHNADVTLEEFGFDITTPDGRELKIFFGENSPIRKLSGNELEAALAEEIKTPNL
jgi:hypothetical protein